MSIRDRFRRFTGRLPSRSINDHDQKIIEWEKECEKHNQNQIDTFECQKEWKNPDQLSLLVWKESEPKYKNEIAEISKNMADLVKSIDKLVNQLNSHEQPRPINTIKKED
jgi:nitrate/nitrite-specific signal transduction histidine kinase